MGILDEAIRDHLELKRKGGAQETDLKRLEDEAFGPPSRPGDAAAAVAAPAGMPEMPEALPSQPEGGDEPPAVPKPEVEAPTAAPSEGGGEDAAPAEAEVGGAFHDFAAQEGLVSSSAEAPAAPAEPEVAPEAPVPEETPPEPPPPAQEASLDDTQPHDMQAELGAVEEPTPSPDKPPANQSSEFEIADEDLELGFEDDEEQPSGDLSVVDEDEELVVEDVDVEEVAEGEDADGEDVLEETPEFLRETPEHDRLWFEQRPPKDFDFDE